MGLIVFTVLLFPSSRRDGKNLRQVVPASGTQTQQNSPVVVQPSPVAVTAVTNQAIALLTNSGVLPDYPDFQQRPLPVTSESTRFQWTSADGKDTNVMRLLAHNPLELERFMIENPRIFKRQLVYLKETPAMVFEQAKATGQTVRQMTLPGFDGQELRVQIAKTEGNVSGRQGKFSGRLADNPDSLVTLAFADGRQAYLVISPKDDLYLIADPREDGQAVLKAIDPNTYGLGPEHADCSIPIPYRSH